MMQHEMRPAMHEEHVLSVIVDAGLQHDPEAGDAGDKTDQPPQRRMPVFRQNFEAAREPSEGERHREIFRPGKFPRHPERQIGGKKAADQIQRRAQHQQRAIPGPGFHEPSINRARSAASRFWLSLYLPCRLSMVSSKPTTPRNMVWM